MNIHFDVTLNNFGTMVFEANQEKNRYYTVKDMLLQSEKSDFILAMIKEGEAHEERSNLTTIKNSEVNNKHKNKYII